MLCFFRDAACPFCNLRIYELTKQYNELKQSGVEVVAVFSSTPKEVKRHVAKHPRPFRMISDPDLRLYTKYRVEQSASALFKALLFKLPTIYKGILAGGRPYRNKHVRIVPADFLIDRSGQIVDCWYGKDTADHIPMSRVAAFAAKAISSQSEAFVDEIKMLKQENLLLKKTIQLLGNKYKKNNERRRIVKTCN